MILAGDIGGTSTRLGIFHLQGTQVIPQVVERYSSRSFGGLTDILSQFLAVQRQPFCVAAFGIAGPVLDGRVHTPNLPWIVDASAVATVLNGPPVFLLNDLEANACGVFALPPTDFEPLNSEATADPTGNLAIISAGTGLGEAGIMFDGNKLRPLACEGGHAGFAPENELEAELWRFLAKKFGRVSAERILSGPGLFNLYTFLRDTGRGVESPALAAEIGAAADPAAVVSRSGLSGSSDLCAATLELFVRIYGSEAGNLALKLKATRGVMIGGGIAPHLRPLLDRRFLDPFTAKGRMRPMLEAIPVQLIRNDQAALYGSALYAALKAGLLEHPHLAA
ncbi:MAG TPA: glucokinase [Verrucomicrobiota bacterium]|nr:glucokinase [Verrucomicrobiales bacterium]HRI11989.1 glucokinase [Verrucomicrobiota bacterium]